MRDNGYLFAAAVAGAAAAIYVSKKSRNIVRRNNSIIRQRVSIHKIFRQLGPRNFRRAYRMTYESFIDLCNLLRSHIRYLLKKQNSTSGLERRGKKKMICIRIRVACALRYFAGGSPYDLMLCYGISRASVFCSIWLVVEAINRCHSFDIVFPSDHEQQREMAALFKEKSSAGIDCCVGAVDGILIWIARPTIKDCIKAACAPQKFFCGRKHKYGLNCQAICDAKGRFLDVSLIFPGSTSDILSFESSSFFSKLQEGLLADGLCIFGDNAYINSTFMATPYTGVSGGVKDSYNFYHSQLRINIECAFGRLVHRWSILRSATPYNVSIAKTSAMVVALAKLHNFCIDHNDQSIQGQSAVDILHQELIGAVPLVESEETGISLPIGIMHGGEHFDDMDRNVRRRRDRENRNNNNLPRERLCNMIQEKGLTRPAPIRNRH
jgi:hypothetical protein